MPTSIILAGKLKEVLGSRIGNKHIMAFLSDADGRLIAFNGGSESDAKALAAILDNIWFAYNRHGTPPTSSQDGSRDGLNTISLTNEKSKIAAVRIGKFLLCIVSNVEASRSDIERDLESLSKIINL